MSQKNISKKKRKKVLIISYYWPPCGGIGVLRCLKLAKYLSEFGWEPVVYTAENAHYPSYDEGNFKDIPEGMTILKQPIFEPYTFYKKFTGQPKNANVNHALVATDQKRGLRHTISVWIRSNIFIPDARAFWIRPSVKFLVNYLKNNPVDAIFSDGPPHTNNVIACRIKQKTGIPWIADFQDPWTQVDLYERLILTDWADRKYHDLEQETFQNADRITIASPSWKTDLEDIGAKNVSVFYYGYDKADFQDLIPKYDKKFTLTHTGLLGADRMPTGLFEAVSELAEENKAFRDAFRFRTVGKTDNEVLQKAKDLGIWDLLEVISQVPREQALQYTANSQMLLLLLNLAGNTMGRIPGKLYEYFAVKRPILCLGPTGSDSDRMISEVKAGFSANYHEKDKIKKLLFHYFQIWQERKVIPLETANFEKYTNYAQTQKIAQLLDQITR